MESDESVDEQAHRMSGTYSTVQCSAAQRSLCFRDAMCALKETEKKITLVQFTEITGVLQSNEKKKEKKNEKSAMRVDVRSSQNACIVIPITHPLFPVKQTTPRNTPVQCVRKMCLQRA